LIIAWAEIRLLIVVYQVNVTLATFRVCCVYDFKLFLDHEPWRACIKRYLLLRYLFKLRLLFLVIFTLFFSHYL
jgi:hypothetical protein